MVNVLEVECSRFSWTQRFVICWYILLGKTMVINGPVKDNSRVEIQT